MKRTVIGGAAAPRAMIETFEKEYNVNVVHAWGMTEMSPLGTACNLKKKHAGLSLDDRIELSLKQGRAVYGVDMKIVDGAGKDLPWDGKAFGNLLVRGPWITSGYFRSEGGDAVDADNWFDRAVANGFTAASCFENSRIAADRLIKKSDRANTVLVNHRIRINRGRHSHDPTAL